MNRRAGLISERYPDIYDEWRDSVMTSLSQFWQDNKLLSPLNLNYNIPVNKLPLFSWVTSNPRYNATV